MIRPGSSYSGPKPYAASASPFSALSLPHLAPWEVPVQQPVVHPCLTLCLSMRKLSYRLTLIASVFIFFSTSLVVSILLALFCYTFLQIIFI